MPDNESAKAHPAVSIAIEWLKAHNGSKRFQRALASLAADAEAGEELGKRCIDTMERMGPQAGLSEVDILGLVVGIQSRM